MKQVEEWLEKYLEIGRNLLAKLSSDAGCYSDDKFAAMEAALDLRQEMLQELADLQVNDRDRQLYRNQSMDLEDLETRIEVAVKAMMTEVKMEQEELQNQRSELNRHKVASRSYAGMMGSIEGYFIDKKK